jgi:hypothetical protein
MAKDELKQKRAELLDMTTRCLFFFPVLRSLKAELREIMTRCFFSFQF